MSKFYPELYESFGGDINVTVDLSNYATKTDIKSISHVNTSSFALKTNLANLKTGVDKLDIDKLGPVPTDLSKLSNVIKNDVVKKKPTPVSSWFSLNNSKMVKAVRISQHSVKSY